MRLSHIHETLTESIHTIIFVDFDETLGHIDPEHPAKGLEIITLPTMVVAMRHGWKKFLYNLNSLEHSGNIHIYSAGGGQIAFPYILKKHRDLNFIDVLTTKTMIKNAHPHSILIDDDPSISGVKFGQYKAKRIGLTQDNIVEVSPFKGEAVENGLQIAFAKVKRKIAGLEMQYQEQAG